MEIERKFLLRSLPKEINFVKEFEIEQAYVCLEDKTETRIRKRSQGDEIHYYLTVKAGSGLSRAEVEVEITETQYNELLSVTSRVLTKTRKITSEGFEVDIYKGKLQGLMVVEIEFTSEKEANSFKPPFWFNKEVTEDKRFKNRALAIEGIVLNV